MIVSFHANKHSQSPWSRLYFVLYLIDSDLRPFNFLQLHVWSSCENAADSISPSRLNNYSDMYSSTAHSNYLTTYYQSLRWLEPDLKLTTHNQTRLCLRLRNIGVQES